jgi:hypothetical protein
METHHITNVRLLAEIPTPVKHLLEDLKLLQAQIDALPGPRLHQDHDFSGEKEALETLHGWLNETAWVPYWGQPEDGKLLLLLGGRDPWIETLELRLWGILEQIAHAACCEITGRGAVSPKDAELRVIHVLYPEIAATNGVQ